VHDFLPVLSADGTALKIIDVTVTGTNDAPVIVARRMLYAGRHGGPT